MTDNINNNNYMNLYTTFINFTDILAMAGFKGACLVVLAVCLTRNSIASAVQQPLVSDSHQASLSLSSGKPLVDSEALQALISADRLFARSKDLFKIAELSHDDYNRPTRVIGSEGKINLVNELITPPPQRPFRFAWDISTH